MMSLLAPENRAGFRVLIDEIGWWRAFRMGARVEARRMRGEPFGDLEPPASEAERASREQMAPAVLLYQQLTESVGQERAYEIVESVVTTSAVEFLERTVGRLRREELGALDDDEREDFVRSKGEAFHNAELQWDAIEPECVEFTVTRCHFAELCERLDLPELAPVFCAGDGEFFGGVEEEVALERETTIAHGGERCPFRISFS